MADPNPRTSPDRPPSPEAQQPPPVAPTAASEVSSRQQNPLDKQQQPDEQSRLPFQPLFALVTDTTSRATHHPKVHYIFSDDDPDILTEALAQYGHQSQSTTSPKDPSASGSTTTKSPSSSINERAIILDLVPRANNNPGSSDDTALLGYDVAWASSLSTDWAVVSAKISPMAADDNTRNNNNNNNAATAAAANPSPEDDTSRLMLRIEGVGSYAGIASGPCVATNTTTRARGSSTPSRRRQPSLEDLRMSGSSGIGGVKRSASGNAGNSPAQQQQRGKEDYGAIVEEFDKRMGMLRKVVDAGLERQRQMSNTIPGEGEREGAGVNIHEGGGNTTEAEDTRSSRQQQQHYQAEQPGVT